jgi:diguanylate cyclase (GGDEF)-like protein/PAS domain S-box-containing protein
MDSPDGGPARLAPTPALPEAPARALPAALAFALRFLAVASGYYLAARLGLLIPYVGTHISLVWLPTGIAVAAFRRWGAGMAPAVYIGAVAANASIGGPLGIALLVGLGNTAGTGLAAWLMRRWAFDDRLLRRHDVSAFVGAVVLGMGVTSLNGIAWLRAVGAPEAAQLGQAWISWLVGDTVGALLAGVPLIAWSRRAASAGFLGRHGAGNLALLAIVLACGGVAFSAWPGKDSALVFPLLALPFFVLAMLAMRGGVVVSSTGVLLLSMAAAYGTAHGHGPFALHDARAGSLALWSYITAQACTSLLICGMGMALQTSRRQFAAFLQNTPDGILVIDEEGLLVHANAAVETMLGLPRRDLAGRRASEVLEGGAAAVAALVAEGALQSTTELALPQAAGGLLHVECQVARYQKASGDWQTHVSLRDITERHHALLALRRSEQRIRTITDNLPSLISHFDRDYRYTFANAHYLRWFGLAESPVGKTVAEVFGQQVFDNVRPRLDEALSGREVVFDHKMSRPDAPEHLQIHYIPDRDEAGQVTGIYGLVMDRTEQRRAQERTEASERQLRAVTDNLPVLITYVDAGETLRFMNGTFRDWLGIDLDKAIDRPLAEVVGAEHYAARREQLHAALAGQRVEFEVVSQTLTGPRNLQTVYIPDLREDGSARGVFTLSTDVTALKNVERALQRLARIDTLTGLANRRQFDELLEQSLARHRRAKRPLALIFLDIDHFKTINDTHGHGAGDAVLKEFAARLQASLRETDVAARLSGDEFVVILDGLVASDEATGVATKLLQAIRVPMAIGDQRLDVTASMGLAYLDGSVEIDAKALMLRADRALYRAKDGGRDALAVDAGQG